jgi:hypothetical protein
VYDTSLVRRLCAEIVAEKDTERIEELISFLQAVVKENTEEIGVRMAFLAKKYADAAGDSSAAD